MIKGVYNNMPEENMKYIYNVDQANYYINEGCRVLGTGRHNQTKNVFFIFGHDETQTAYEKWCKKCLEFKQQKICK